jgi:hypothetical protein
VAELRHRISFCWNENGLHRCAVNHSLRASVLDLAHRRDEVVWSVERSREMQTEMVKEISGVLVADGSDVARKILESLRALHTRHKAQARYIGSTDRIVNTRVA